mgnify:CR=1 FL=1
MDDDSNPGKTPLQGGVSGASVLRRPSVSCAENPCFNAKSRHFRLFAPPTAHASNLFVGRDRGIIGATGGAVSDGISRILQSFALETGSFFDFETAAILNCWVELG